MEGRGSQTEAPRMSLPRRITGADGVIFWTAFAVSLMFVVGQIGFVVTVTPVMLTLFRDSSAALPPFLSVADSLGPFGLVAVLSVIDIAVFAGFHALSRKYWVGMLFVPPLLYMGSAVTLFALWWPTAAGLLR